MGDRHLTYYLFEGENIGRIINAPNHLYGPY